MTLKTWGIKHGSQRRRKEKKERKKKKKTHFSGLNQRDTKHATFILASHTAGGSLYSRTYQNGKLK